MVREEPEAAIAKTLRLVVMENTQNEYLFRSSVPSTLWSASRITANANKSCGYRQKQLGRLIQWLPSIISLRANLPLFPHPDWIIIKKQPLRLPRLSAIRWCLVNAQARHARRVCPSDNAVCSERAVGATQTAAIGLHAPHELKTTLGRM